MSLNPSAAIAGSVQIDGTAVGGSNNATVTDKTTSVDVTSYGDTAIARFPVINDADFQFDMVFDAADPGQIKVFASKSAHTKLTYKRYLNAASYYQMDGYVASLAQTGQVINVPKFTVKIDVSGGAAYHVS